VSTEIFKIFFDSSKNFFHPLVITPRIGITASADWPLRWFIRDNQYVSKTPPHFPRSRIDTK